MQLVYGQVRIFSGQGVVNTIMAASLLPWAQSIREWPIIAYLKVVIPDS
jgi:hypothetical protein